MFSKTDADVVLFGGGHIKTDIVRRNREFAVASVNENREFNRPGTSVVGQGIDRRLDRASGEEDIIKQDDMSIVDGEWDVRALQRWHVPHIIEVIPVERDIERAIGDVPKVILEKLAHPFPHDYTAAVNPYELEAPLGMLLQDLEGKASHLVCDITSLQEHLRIGLRTHEIEGARCSSCPTLTRDSHEVASVEQEFAKVANPLLARNSDHGFSQMYAV